MDTPRPPTLSRPCFNSATGQTVELHHSASRGASLGLTSSATLLEDLPLIRPSVLISVRPTIILQRVLAQLLSLSLTILSQLNAQVPTLFNKIYSGIKAGVKNSPPLKQKAFDLAMQAGRARREWINSNPGRTATDLPFHLKASYAVANKVVFSKIMQKFGGNLRFCMSGGAPLSNDIQDFFADMGIPILEGYGLTETSPLVVCEQFAATEKRQGGLKPIPGVTVTIRDANGAEVQRGSEGEICVEGPNVMVGYLGNSAETEKVIMHLGGRRVFKTGDMGKFGDDGRVLITGRIKEQ